jgi:cation diffusion facilitator family transporter
MQEKLRVEKATKATWVCIITNLLLSIAKLLAGIFGRSAALVADGIHSLSDFLTDIVVIISFKLSARPADHTHDYGHRKFETVAAALIGIMLLFAGLGILWHGVRTITLTITGAALAAPHPFALAVAIISFFANEAIYFYNVRVGKEIESDAVIANAWHHRSDSLSSFGTVLGIGGAIFLGEHWRILDPIAAVIVSIFIIHVAAKTLFKSLNQLTEQALPDEKKRKIRELATSIRDVTHPHHLRTRYIGNIAAIDMHIRVPKTMNIVEAHELATEVERKLKHEFGKESFVSIHIEPEMKDG